MNRKNVALLSISAQEDNLGDIEIRKKLLKCVVDSEVTTIVYRGKSSDSYVEPFTKLGNFRWFKGMVSLQIAYLFHFVRGNRLHFFLAPGPVVFSSRPKNIAKSLINLMNILIARICGGTVHIVGRAYRGDGITRLIEKIIIRLASSVTVRDKLSLQGFSGNIQALPDLAFSGDFCLESDRKYLAISLREEEALKKGEIKRIVDAAKNSGLIPIFVTQVKRDNAWMKSMAGLYGVEIVEWDESSHIEQRRRIESVYRSSYLIISNRLHGLIMGTMAGAYPIPIVTAGNTKLVPTLDVVFPYVRSVEVAAMPSMSIDRWKSLFDQNINNRNLLHPDLERAKTQLNNHFRYLEHKISR